MLVHLGTWYFPALSRTMLALECFFSAPRERAHDERRIGRPNALRHERRRARIKLDIAVTEQTRFAGRVPEKAPRKHLVLEGGNEKARQCGRWMY